MTRVARVDALASRRVAIRVASSALVAVLALLIAIAPGWTDPPREAWFDLYQRVLPRGVKQLPVTIVEIDPKSLEAIGRWPWPRSTLAELIARVGAQQPAAIGIDILMPEPDARVPTPRNASAEVERGTPGTNDAVLARALASTRSVLAVAGMPEPTGIVLRAPPIAVRGTDDPGRLTMLCFAGALGSTEELGAAASGWGLVSVDIHGGIVRRVPLVANVGGTPLGALAVEMFRVATNERALRLVADGTSVRSVGVGNGLIPTEPDGHVRIHFSFRSPERFVSAVDVLQGRVDPETLRRRLVIIAATSLGLGDYHATPIGERMPGAEIHAQLIESLVDGTLLSRPAWAPLAESLAFVLLGALLVWAVPSWKPRNAAALAIAIAVAVVVASFALFATSGLLLAAILPAVGLMLVFTTLLTLTLVEAARHRRALEHALQSEREAAARIAGELDAARSIQLAMLPRADVLADERRVEIAAAMVPAREVGGDLYDFFPLDDRHLFFLVGDVAGKGLSASLFMAVTKALYKSTTLRSSMPDMGALMRAANAEISRDNPHMLFVSAFAGVLDLESGEMTYCNAGHDNPIRVAVDATPLTHVADGDGPPLCVVEDYAYRGATLKLGRGEALCMVTDGVPEARNAVGTMFGGARLDALLSATSTREASASGIVDAILRGVASFTAGAEPYDDLTVLVVRWRGPAGPAAPARAVG